MNKPDGCERCLQCGVFVPHGMEIEEKHGKLNGAKMFCSSRCIEAWHADQMDNLYHQMGGD